MSQTNEFLFLLLCSTEDGQIKSSYRDTRYGSLFVIFFLATFAVATLHRVNTYYLLTVPFRKRIVLHLMSTGQREQHTYKADGHPRLQHCPNTIATHLISNNFNLSLRWIMYSTIRSVSTAHCCLCSSFVHLTQRTMVSTVDNNWTRSMNCCSRKLSMAPRKHSNGHLLMLLPFHSAEFKYFFIIILK